MNVGDLVRVKHDPTGWFGFGMIMEHISADEVKVRWFDDWSDEEPTDITKISSLEVISESRG